MAITQKPSIGIVGGPSLGGGLYGGTLPPEWESRSVANNGFGKRMASRVYRRTFATSFASGSLEETQFKAGMDVCISTSNFQESSFTYTSATGVIGPRGDGTDDTPGAFDTAIRAYLNRLKVLPYDSAVVGATYGGATYGGYTRSKVKVSLQHEVNGKAGAFASSAAAAGVEFGKFWRWFVHLANVVGVRNRLDMTWIVTAWGIDHNSVDGYWPDDASGKNVDTIGSDRYIGFNTTAGWVWDGKAPAAFAPQLANDLAIARKYGKALCWPEFDIAESGNDSQMQTYLEGVASQITAVTDVPITGLYVFAQVSNQYQNWNKAAAQDTTNNKAHVGKHAGLAALVALGGNDDLASPAAAAPSAPVITGWTSASDGTYLDVTIAAALAGETVTGRDWYLSSGVTTAPKNVSNNTTGPTAPGTLTYRFTTLPGTQYSPACVAFNTAGRSGYSNIPAASTRSANNANHAPTITSVGITEDATDPYTKHFAMAATDPDGNPITYSWDITGGGGAAQPLPTATGQLTLAPGAYVAVASASDNGTPALADTRTIRFSVAAGPGATDLGIWLPRSNDPILPGLGAGLRGAHTLINSLIEDLQARRSPGNSVAGLIGATFDPGVGTSGAGVFTPSNGSIMWAEIKLEGSTITAVDISTAVAQVGNSSAKLAFYDAFGVPMTFDNTFDGDLAVYGGVAGGDVDTWLKQAAGAIPPLVLATPITNRLFGETVIVEMFFGTPTTQPQLRAGTAASVMAKAGGRSVNPRWGSNASVADLVAPAAAYAAWAAINHPYIGLIGSS